MTDQSGIKNKLVPARYNILKEEHGVVLALEMPGVPKDGLDIRVEGDHLFVEGKKLVLKADGKSLLKEIRESDYGNVFTIDDTIDREKIEAKMENGVVILHLALRESQKPRKIKVVAK